LAFDLKHFREILRKYRKISQYVAIYSWNHDILWLLAWQYNTQDSNAEDWLFNYREKREFSLPLPILPATGVKEIDLWIQRI